MKPEELMTKANGLSDKGVVGSPYFLIGWIGVNLCGWMIGIIGGWFRSYDLAYIISRWGRDAHILDGILRILAITWFWFGAGIGVMQALRLGHWRIPVFPWIIATTAGWGIPIKLFSWLQWQMMWGSASGYHSYMESLKLLYPAGLMIIGASIGTLQALVARTSISRPGMWIAANVFGLLALGLLVHRFFLESYRLGSYTHIAWPIIWVFLPVFATLITAIPTGMVLLRYGNGQPFRPGSNKDEPTSD